jgi:hypothetical protein
MVNVLNSASWLLANRYWLSDDGCAQNALI